MLWTAELDRSDAFLNLKKKEKKCTKSKRNPGYSRFFSPLHLDPAFILPETATGQVISAIESSSTSNSTAMPGKNNLYGESPVTDEPEAFPGTGNLEPILSFHQQKCNSAVSPINFKKAGTSSSIWIMQECLKKIRRDVNPSSIHKQNVKRDKLTIFSGLSAATSS